MKRLALLLALATCVVAVAPAAAHNLYRKPRVGVTGDIYTFKGTKWQPGQVVFWEYHARPRGEAIQEGTLTANSRGRFRFRFRDFNLGKHKMCFVQIDTRYPPRARSSGTAPNGRLFRRCKTYRVFGTD